MSSVITGHAGLRARISRVGAAAAIAALGLSGLAGLTPAQAAVVTPGDLVINEVYGGGGNSGAAYQNDFVELRNTSDKDISIDGWSLQYASKKGGFNNTLALSGTVPAGKTFLIQLAAGNGNGEALPTADATGDINASGTGGVFALSSADGKLTCTGATCASDPAVVDLVGWGGATTFSGDAAAPGTSNDTSVARVASTGENSTDFTAGAPTPQPSGASEPAPEDPAEPAPEDPAEPAPEDPAEPAPEDPADPADPSAITPIAKIQGTGAESPLQGKTVTTEGVVTAVYATGGLDGYVIQTGGTGGALDFSSHTGSTALFVYSSETMDKVAVGDSVQVTGEVSEYYGSTQITVAADGLKKADKAFEPVKPLTVDLFPTDEAQRESIEHMLYQPGKGDFTVTDVYPTNKFGEVTLAIGDKPLRQAGDVMAPGADATAYYEEQQTKKVLLDDGKTTNFSKNPDQSMSWLTTEEPVRVGAGATFTQPVVVAYSHDQWRLNPTSPWASHDTDGVDFENTRQDTPNDVGGDLQVATFNVLNYFTTLGEDVPGCTPYTNMDGEGTNVRGGCDLRGAWDDASFKRQQGKIVEAISGTGADVVGLMEIENSARLGETPDEATATLVDALNAKDGEGTWAYIPTGDAYKAAGAEGGQDVITNAIIYKPAAVTPRGGVEVLVNDQAFDNAREPIGQVFVPVTERDGKKLEGKPFFFTVNHFKSKGSKDGEDANLPEDPVQGNARTSRVKQAKALNAWANGRAKELGVDAVLHGGDFNAYTMEDPLQVFYDGGFVNTVREHESEAWSYSFGGMVGSLDHVLANAAAAERVTGATGWSINGPESVMTQYSRYRNNEVNLVEEGVYGSSDHNPIIVGLDAGFPAQDNAPAEPGTDPGAGSDRPGQNPGRAPEHAGQPGTPDHAGQSGRPDHAGRGLAALGGASSLARTGVAALGIAGVAVALIVGGATVARREDG